MKTAIQLRKEREKENRRKEIIKAQKKFSFQRDLTKQR